MSRPDACLRLLAAIAAGRRLAACDSVPQKVSVDFAPPSGGAAGP